MKQAVRFFGIILLLMTPILVNCQSEKSEKKGENKTIEKEKGTMISGNIVIEMDADKAPLTVKNVSQYAEKGFYDGTIFHRVIDGFVAQGGGFTEDMNQKETDAPVKNEASNGLSNVLGSVAMARTQVVGTATSQLYINLKDNKILDHQDTCPQGFRYAGLGPVVE